MTTPIFPFTGKCHYCGKPVKSPRRYCGSYCQNKKYFQTVRSLKSGRASEKARIDAVVEKADPSKVLDHDGREWHYREYKQQPQK